MNSVATPAPAGAQTAAGVPFFSQAATFERLWPQIEAHTSDVLERGKYSHGRKVLELERAIAQYP
ncbi:hypothetical protein TN53_42295, partial [Streptomyces sp. WM6386]